MHPEFHGVLPSMEYPGLSAFFLETLSFSRALEDLMSRQSIGKDGGEDMMLFLVAIL